MVSVALQAAQAHLQTWQKGEEQKNANAVKNNINSIFEAANNAIEKAKNDGQNVVNEATGKIDEKSNDAKGLGDLNKQLVEEYNNQIKEIQQKQDFIKEQVQERQEKEAEIKELGGQVEDNSTPETETVIVEEYSSENKSEKSDNDKNARKAEKRTIKAQKHNSKVKGEDNQAKIQQLNQEISNINGTIKDAQTVIAEPQGIVTEIIENFTTNAEQIVQDKNEVSTIKSEADSQLVNIEAGVTKDINIKSKDLSQKIQSETTAQTKNTTDATKAVALKTTLEAEEAAAQVAKNAPAVGSIITAVDSGDSQARQDAIRELGIMDSDLNNTSGAAKINSENIQLSTNNTQSIENAVQQLRSGDFQSYTQTMNEVFSNAMQSINEQLTIQLPGQEAASESDSSDADSQTENTSIIAGNSNNSNQIAGSILSSLGGNIGNAIGNAIGGDTGKIIGDTINKIGSSVVSSFFT